jgi:hypothetical protein
MNIGYIVGHKWATSSLSLIRNDFLWNQTDDIKWDSCINVISGAERTGYHLAWPAHASGDVWIVQEVLSWLKSRDAQEIARNFQKNDTALRVVNSKESSAQFNEAQSKWEVGDFRAAQSRRVSHESVSGSVSYLVIQSVSTSVQTSAQELR